MYFCGPTVYQRIHVGNARPFVISMWLKRWLERQGYEVTLVENITDINDKIYEAAPGASAKLAGEATRWYIEETDLLGLGRPDVEPKATDSIPEILAHIEALVAEGYAYDVDGDVYFRVARWPEYGALSGQRPDQVEEQEPNPRKEDPRDFALWKATKPGEDTSWESVWGRGRPGWHIECSAMAEAHLGHEFEIHGGGLDLVFPHHENEIAQSRAAGDGFARYWLHNGLLGLAGEKMSKSLGNSLLVTDVLTRVRPPELRYYLVQAHYRSLLEYSEDALEEAAAAYQRIERFAVRAAEVLMDAVATPGDEPAELPVSFRSAMDEDLSVPAALAAVHACVRDGNQALAASDKVGARASLARLRGMLGVLGLDPLAPPWAGASGSGDRLRQVVGSLVKLALQQRDAARARRDYATADAVREGLEEIGVVVEDTPEGPRWELKR